MRDVLRLLRLLRPYAGMVLLSLFTGLATIAAGVGLLTTSAYLISAAALRPSIAVLQVAIVGVRFFGLSRGILRYLERLASHSVNFRLLAVLRVNFFKALEPLAPSGLRDERSGDLLTRAISDVETLQDFYVRTAAPPLVAGLASAGMALFLWGYHPSLSLILLAFLFLVGLVLPLITWRQSGKPSRDFIRARSELNAGLVDAVQGLPDLLVFGGEEDHSRRLWGLNEEFANSQRRLARQQAIQVGLTTLLVNLGGFAILWASIPLVTNGQIAGVSLALLVLGSLAAFEAVQPLPQAAQHLEPSLAAGRRLFELLDRPSPVTHPIQPIQLSASGQAGLRIRGLKVRYGADLPWVLDDLDLDLPAGKHVALVGTSGTGKTTLAYVLMRFQEYQAGSVELNGLELHDLDPDAVRGCASLVSQQIYLFSGTIEQNLRLARPEAGPEELREALQLAQLGKWINTLPDGLATAVRERGMNLSGGERQRLALAQAVLRDTPLWILDEPTANLDATTERALQETIFSAAHGRSLLYITHRLAGLERMDEICVLEGGRIVQRGSHAGLSREEGLYRRLWETQRRILCV